MQHTYLITYDICDATRLRRVFTAMRNWGDHLQYSVFECRLNGVELAELRGILSDLICQLEDQILVIDLGPVASRGQHAIDAIGKPYTRFASPCYIF